MARVTIGDGNICILFFHLKRKCNGIFDNESTRGDSRRRQITSMQIPPSTDTIFTRLSMFQRRSSLLYYLYSIAYE